MTIDERIAQAVAAERARCVAVLERQHAENTVWAIQDCLKAAVREIRSDEHKEPTQ